LKDGRNLDKEQMEEAYAEWLSRGAPQTKVNGKCDNTPPPPQAPTGNCDDDTCQKAATVAFVGGIAYVVYRCLRMVPSLFPPLWPTLPANIAVP